MDTSDQSSDQQHHDDGRHDDSPASTTAAKDSTADDGNGSDDCLSKKLFSDLCTDIYFPRRYLVVLLLFVGLVVVHAQRVNVGVAVVSIIDSRHRVMSTEIDNTSDTSAIPITSHSLDNINWDSHMIGWLHAIFYVGLLISQVPCGYIVTLLPSHSLYGGCILMTHSLNFLLPLSVEKFGYVITCTIRLMQGLVEGLLYPSCYDVLRHWTVPEERSRTGATVLTGAYIGPTLGMIASGMLNHHVGWQSVFYFHGGVGVALFFIWLFLVYEKPSVHPSISAEECKMIESKQGEAAIIYEHGYVPWKAIFTSMPVYALIVCNFARSFVFYMLLTNQPSYMNVFKFSLAEIGLFSSIPYAFMGVLSLSSGLVADYLNSKNWTTLTVIRKLFTCSGFGLSAFFFFGLALVVNGIHAVVFLTLAVGFGGLAISGWQINHLDLAPRYAGVLVGITMTAGMLAGVINPLVVAALVQYHTIEEWHHVFFLTGCVLTFALLFYLVFGSGERQSWAAPPVPSVRIVDNADLLKSKPYGTFMPQFKHAPVNDEVKPLGVEDQSAKPSTEQPTSPAEKTRDLDVDAVDADDSANHLRKRGAVTESDR